MNSKISNYKKIKIKYLEFIKSQEILSEPFRDKIKQLNEYYLPISEKINKDYIKNKKTMLIGLTGGQGSGKSTISQIIKIILKEGFNLNTIIFSIDDFYKTLKERKQMSKKISPLFLTRGVPGTHDTNLLMKCIKNLTHKKFKKTSIPNLINQLMTECQKNWQYIKNLILLFLRMVRWSRTPKTKRFICSIKYTRKRGR